MRLNIYFGVFNNIHILFLLFFNQQNLHLDKIKEINNSLIFKFLYQRAACAEASGFVAPDIMTKIAIGTMYIH